MPSIYTVKLSFKHNVVNDIISQIKINLILHVNKINYFNELNLNFNIKIKF